MPESFLSFDNSSVFRNNLIVQNLAPYQIQGAFSPPLGNILYEVSPLSNFSVIDSPNTLISTNQLANQFLDNLEQLFWIYLLQILSF